MIAGDALGNVRLKAASALKAAYGTCESMKSCQRQRGPVAHWSRAGEVIVTAVALDWQCVPYAVSKPKLG